METLVVGGGWREEGVSQQKSRVGCGTCRDGLGIKSGREGKQPNKKEKGRTSKRLHWKMRSYSCGASREETKKEPEGRVGKEPKNYRWETGV